jgi:outer membrane protein OmpA-like peptidoglycan-associated protein
VIKGEAPHSLLEKQQDTLETIHLEFATQLAEFNGDPRPLAPVRRLLEDCIETVLTTDQARAKRKGAWLKWAIPLALLVTALLAFYVRSTIRWNRAVNALRATPGLVVLNADRDWGTWKITGLKDPLARDPRAVIATSDVGRPDVDATWLGYMSLDPTMVHVRAVHSFDSLTKVLERGRILFATGSAQLDPAAIVEIGSAASLIRRLDEIAENLNGVTRVGLTGRTDFTGADTTNATLAAQRVTAVSDYLVSLGIQRERLLPDPVATSKPLVAVSEDERARINRSVSFSVSLSVATPPGGIQ